MTIHDVSVPLRNGMHFWEGDPEPSITRLEDHERGDAWTTTHLSVAAHIGTHVDAPRHRIRGGNTVDALDLQTLIGSAYVVDLMEVRFEIGAKELDARNIPANVKRLLFKTRNETLWEREGFQKEFIALSADGAQWVVEHGIRLVGMDYLSADLYLTDTAPAHDTLLRAGVVIVEGMMLQSVAAGWYTLICLPIKVQGADGAPARAVLLSGSIVNEEEK
jgi:arylformamidase